MPPKKNILSRNTKQQSAMKNVRKHESEEEHDERLHLQSQRQRELRNLETDEKKGIFQIIHLKT